MAYKEPIKIIEVQNKPARYTIKATEWNKILNELILQGNRAADILVDHSTDLNIVATTGIAADSVDTVHIKDNAVTTEKIVDGSITTEKFAPGATSPNAETVNKINGIVESEYAPVNLSGGTAVFRHYVGKGTGSTPGLLNIGSCTHNGHRYFINGQFIPKVNLDTLAVTNAADFGVTVSAVAIDNTGAVYGLKHTIEANTNDHYITVYKYYQAETTTVKARINISGNAYTNKLIGAFIYNETLYFGQYCALSGSVAYLKCYAIPLLNLSTISNAVTLIQETITHVNTSNYRLCTDGVRMTLGKNIYSLAGELIGTCDPDKILDVDPVTNTFRTTGECFLVDMTTLKPQAFAASISASLVDDNSFYYGGYIYRIGVLQGTNYLFRTRIL